MQELRIGIIGGGIGGTSAALQLASAGFDVEVFEKLDQAREVGAGINITPNAAKILHRLGLQAEMTALGVIPQAWHQRRWQTGETLQWAPLGAKAIELFGAPQYQMHRADLLNLLTSKIAPGRLHTGKDLAGLEDDGEQVRAVFADGSKHSFDLVIGADGIHSKSREILFGPARPVFKNCMAYRGLIPRERIAHLEIPVEAQIWMGPGRHLVHYYVRGGALLNFVANVDKSEWSEESWTTPGNAEDLRGEFAGWHGQVQGILRAVTETFILALHDRQPLSEWSKGRVVLLGDACHPMEPHFAQGAAQAIEDGATLAACLLDQPGDVEGALGKYRDLRLPRTSLIQGLADQNRRTFHMPDGPEQRDRDAALASGEAGFTPSRIGWLYGHDASDIDYTGETNYRAA